MKRNRRLLVTAISISLVLSSAYSYAQQPPASRALTIYPPAGLPIIPVMEGWYDNGDGTVTISFGYHNKNAESVVVIPFGETNRIEPAQFDRVQPTYFDRGRHTGVFTVTLPEEMHDESVWWYVKTGQNEEFEVPGRGSSEAYQLDRRPRPQGSVSPLVWFDEDGERSSGPAGIVTELGDSVRVGSPVTLTVHATDPSERDPNDPRFEEPVALRVNWAVHQGPAAVTFATHESTVIPEPSEPPDPTTGAVALSAPQAQRLRQSESEPRPEDVTLGDGYGTANVYATFNEPGQYMLRIQVDNWAAPDSRKNDQCCWTNVYQRIAVGP